MAFMGKVDPLKIDLDEVQRRFNRPNYAAVRQSLADIQINSLYDLFSTYTGTGSDLRPWTKGALINTDKDLRLSYLAGWGINSDMADHLYRQMLKYRPPPTESFTVSPDLLSPPMAELGPRL